MSNALIYMKGSIILIILVLLYGSIAYMLYQLGFWISLFIIVYTLPIAIAIFTTIKPTPKKIPH